MFLCEIPLEGLWHETSPSRQREWVRSSRTETFSSACFPFFSLVSGPRRSLSLKLRDTRVYEHQRRTRLGTTAHFCKVVATWLPCSPFREGLARSGPKRRTKHVLWIFRSRFVQPISLFHGASPLVCVCVQKPCGTLSHVRSRTTLSPIKGASPDGSGGVKLWRDAGPPNHHDDNVDSDQ